MGRAEFQWYQWFQRMTVYELLSHEVGRLWESALTPWPSPVLAHLVRIAGGSNPTAQDDEFDRIDTETHTIQGFTVPLPPKK